MMVIITASLSHTQCANMTSASQMWRYADVSLQAAGAWCSAPLTFLPAPCARLLVIINVSLNRGAPAVPAPAMIRSLCPKFPEDDSHLRIHAA